MWFNIFKNDHYRYLLGQIIDFYGQKTWSDISAGACLT